MLYQKYVDLSFPNFKCYYFSQFYLGSLWGNIIPKRECYLCELFFNQNCDEKCKPLWKPFKKGSSCPCIDSYYGTLYNSLTKHQKALICYMIASLPIKYIDTVFHKRHLLANTSEENITKAYKNKRDGVFEPEPLY